MRAASKAAFKFDAKYVPLQCHRQCGKICPAQELAALSRGIFVIFESSQGDTRDFTSLAMQNHESAPSRVRFSEGGRGPRRRKETKPSWRDLKAF
jgi:hypothetical protein